MIEWLYLKLGEVLGVSTAKRQVKLCDQRNVALGIFGEVQKKLESAKESIATESIRCEERMNLKRKELESEQNTYGALLQEEKKIRTTMNNINKMLGEEV